MVHLSFHDFDKAEHFVGAILLLVVLGRQIKRVLCSEKLYDLEAAFVEVKVDVPLFKMRSEGFHHHRHLQSQFCKGRFRIPVELALHFLPMESYSEAYCTNLIS